MGLVLGFILAWMAFVLGCLAIFAVVFLALFLVAGIVWCVRVIGELLFD